MKELDVDATLREILSRVSEEDWSGVLPLATSLTVAMPHLAVGWYMQGIALTGLGRADLGVPPLLRAVSIDPDEPECRVALGAAYAVLGRIPDAAETFREAAELGSYPKAHLAHAESLLWLGRPAEARAVLDRMTDVVEAGVAVHRARLVRAADSTHFSGSPAVLVGALLMAFVCFAMAADSEPGITGLGALYLACLPAYLHAARAPGPRPWQPPAASEPGVALGRWLAEHGPSALAVAPFVPFVVAWAYLGGGGARRPVAANLPPPPRPPPPPEIDDEPPSPEPPAKASALAPCPFAGRARPRGEPWEIGGVLVTAGDCAIRIGEDWRVHLGSFERHPAWGFVDGDGRIYEGSLPDDLDPTDWATTMVYGRRTPWYFVGTATIHDGERVVADVF